MKSWLNRTFEDYFVEQRVHSCEKQIGAYSPHCLHFVNNLEPLRPLLLEITIVKIIGEVREEYLGDMSLLLQEVPDQVRRFSSAARIAMKVPLCSYLLD